MINDIHHASKLLRDQGIDSAKLDVELIASRAMGISREQLFLSESLQFTEKQKKYFAKMIERRANREPLSHILGIREFYGREFKVTKAVLDPRPDTETLIDAILDNRYWGFDNRDLMKSKQITNPESRVPSTEDRISILDIGTGSGCIILTLLAEIKIARGVAMDISPDALAIARENASMLGVSERILLVESDLFQLPHSLCDQLEMSDFFAPDEPQNAALFDFITSNPPYIATEEIQGLMPEVRDFEPKIALNGGKDGLDSYRILAKTTASLLKPNGLIFLEIGETQAADVVALFSAAGWIHQKTVKDLAARDRCVIFKHQPTPTK